MTGQRTGDFFPGSEKIRNTIVSQNIFPEKDMGNERSTQRIKMGMEMEGLDVFGVSDVGGQDKPSVWNEDSMLACERFSKQLIAVVDGGGIGYGYWMGKIVNDALVKTFTEFNGRLLDSPEQVQRFFEQVQIQVNATLHQQKDNLEKARRRPIDRLRYRGKDFKGPKKVPLREGKVTANTCTLLVDSGLGIFKIANIGDTKAVVINKKNEIINPNLTQNDDTENLTDSISFGQQPTDISVNLSSAFNISETKLVVLASAGFWNEVSEKDVLNFSTSIDIPKLAEVMTDWAVAKNSEADNVTVQVVEFK